MSGIFCRNPSCKVGEIIKDQYGRESDEAFRAREESGYCRPKCRRLYPPSPPSRVSSLEGGWFNHQRPELRAVVKSHTIRDKKFLAWLLPRPCELAIKGGFGPCLGQNIYHHTSGGGMGQKGHDTEAITVCYGHHELFDNASKKGVGIFTEQELKRIIARNQMEYVAQGHKIKG